jgi:DnaJ-domain-containing protein 1
MQRQRTRLTDPGFDAPPPDFRGCDHPGCAGAGLYRAPKGRDRLNEYFWFCLDHVREYNSSWDYYAGMTTEQIEAETRRDTTWQRPTWPMGQWAKHERFLRDHIVHGAGFEFGREAGVGGEERLRNRRAGRTPEEEALEQLGLTPPVDFPAIKARYRELVKQHHPDTHGGDRAAEETLKVINQAYTTLKACYGT